MAEASIPVDLFNPGQIFACLGFMEVADVLLGDAECGFDWSDKANARFALRAAGGENPFAVVLGFLSHAQIRRCAPFGYADPPVKKQPLTPDGDDDVAADQPLDLFETFPSPAGDRMALPIQLVVVGRPSISLDHWADGSSRNDFKLYAGNRSADRIARAMLRGTHEKPKKKQTIGDVKTLGIAALWTKQSGGLMARPFDVLTLMGGSFNFDPRGAWRAIDAGYSPNKQKHGIAASPVVELLAALGLKDARPDEYETRAVRYGVWGRVLPAVLARPALAGVAVGIPAREFRTFRFILDLSGKNKVVTFAEEETNT